MINDEKDMENVLEVYKKFLLRNFPYFEGVTLSGIDCNGVLSIAFRLRNPVQNFLCKGHVFYKLDAISYKLHYLDKTVQGDSDFLERKLEMIGKQVEELINDNWEEIKQRIDLVLKYGW